MIQKIAAADGKSLPVKAFIEKNNLGSWSKFRAHPLADQIKIISYARSVAEQNDPAWRLFYATLQSRIPAEAKDAIRIAKEYGLGRNAGRLLFRYICDEADELDLVYLQRHGGEPEIATKMRRYCDAADIAKEYGLKEEMKSAALSAVRVGHELMKEKHCSWHYREFSAIEKKYGLTAKEFETGYRWQ